MPKTRSGALYGRFERSSSPETTDGLTIYLVSDAVADADRFRAGDPKRVAFFVLHLVGFVAHLSGWCLVLAEAELGARLQLWRMQAEHVTDFIGGSFVQMRVMPDLELQPAWIAFAWFMCSFLFHALVLVSWLCGTIDYWYFAGIRRCTGAWRWAEYTVSASIMLLGASALLGTRELRVVIASTVSMGTTMFFGYLTEVNSQRHICCNGTRWDASLFECNRKVLERFLPHIMGYVPFVLSWWLALDSYYLATDAFTASGAIVEDAGEALWAGFGLFMLFGSVQFVLLARHDGPEWYWLGEMTYVVLSVAAKFTMALILLYRGLTPERIAQAKTVDVVPACM